MEKLKPKLLGIHFDLWVYEEDSESEDIPEKNRIVDCVQWHEIFEDKETLAPKEGETIREYLNRHGCKNRKPACINFKKGETRQEYATRNVAKAVKPDTRDVASSARNFWFVYEVTKPDGAISHIYAAYMYYGDYPYTPEDKASIVLWDYWEVSMYNEGSDAANEYIVVRFDLPTKRKRSFDMPYEERTTAELRELDDFLDLKIEELDTVHKQVIEDNESKISAALMDSTLCLWPHS